MENISDKLTSKGKMQRRVNERERERERERRRGVSGGLSC